MVEELPEGYYLANFLTLLDFVTNHYDDILDERELAYAARFKAVDDDAQRLYVRLISRKGPHFRNDKLHYPEIASLSGAAQSLVEAGLMVLDADHPPLELLGLLNRPELAEMVQDFPESFQQLGSPAAYRKAELLEQIAQNLEEGSVRSWLHSRFITYTPLGGDILLVYRLLFFGNLAQDLTEFVLLDLGLLRYEDYKIDKKDRLFQSRPLVTATLHWFQIREMAWLAEQNDQAEVMVELCQKLPDTLGEPSLLRRRDKTLNAVGRFFERKADHERAIALYQQSQSTPARERTARILERQGNFQQAYDLCQAMGNHPQDETEKVCCAVMLPRLQKKLGLPVTPRKRLKHPIVELELTRSDEQTIEETTASYYRDRDIACYHSENRFWHNLFGLTFWDIIFMPVRGAFFNRFQRGPKGMFSPRFRQERAEAIEERLGQVLNDPSWPDQVKHTLAQKQGLANYMVNWRNVDPERLALAMERIPRAHIHAVLDRLSRDLGEYKSGLPDLLVFEGEELGYELVEVKGPGDQIQTNQARWMRFFRQNGIPYRVAKVRWRHAP